MPICSNGVDDMFEKMPWNFDSLSDACFKSYQVKPVIDIVEKMYGGKNLYGATNIIFR